MRKHTISRLWYLLRTGKLIEELSAKGKHKKNSPETEYRLPKVSLETLIGNLTPQLMETTVADGNVTEYELFALAAIARKFQPKRLFEIGTFDGRTSLNLIANAAPGAEMYTLDLPQSDIAQTELRIKTGDRKFIDKPVSGTRFLNSEYAGNIHQIYADSARYDYTHLHNSMDLIFVDGAHSYEYVINDTEKVRPLLRDGKGIILWHDYGWHEVIKALNEYYAKDAFFANLKHIEGTTIAYLICE
jgi:predicted O-methyltransferase YrrM